MDNQQTVLPTLGEVVRFIIDAFGFNEGLIEGIAGKKGKRFRNKLDNFAKERDYNLEEGNEFIEKSLGKYLELIFEDEIKVKVILNMFNYFFHSYKDLVLNLKTNVCNRSEVSLALSQYFINYLTHLIVHLKNEFKIIKTPDDEFWYLISLDDEDISYPFNNVISWWIEKNDYNSLKDFAKDIDDRDSGTIENQYESISRWKKGKHLPDASSIMKLLDQKNPSSKSLVINLFIARAAQYTIDFLGHRLDSKEGKKTYSNLINYFKDCYQLKTKSNLSQKEHITIFYYAVGKENYQKVIDQIHKFSEKDLNYINQLLDNLNEVTSLDFEKKIKDKEIGLDIINKLNQNQIIKEFFEYYLLWKEARIRVLSGDFKEAANLYLEAFEEGRYRAGDNLKEIIREGYCLAAYLGKKDIMARMHKWGVLYKLFEERYLESHKAKGNNISWLALLQKEQFFNIFNLDVFCPQFNKDNLESLKKEEEMLYKYGLDNLNRDLSKWYEEDVADNYNDIGKMVGYPFKTYNQLMKFAITNQLDKVKLSIEKGVRIDTTNNDNATALYYAIKEGNLEIAKYLLEQDKLKSKTINKVTIKDQMTALGELINFLAKHTVKDEELYLEVLKKLLEKGADINQSYSLENFYPLYGFIRLLDGEVKFNKDPKDLENITLRVKYASRDEFLRLSTNKIFAKELYQSDISKTYDLEFYEKHCKKVLNTNNSLIREAISLLLKNEKIEVNKKSWAGYTPLMMAAQLGEENLFKSLLEREADIYTQNNKKYTVLEMSLDNEHYKLANLILDNCDIEKMINLSKNLKIIIFDLYDRLVIPDLAPRLSKKDKKLIKEIIDKLNPLSTKIILYASKIHTDYWKQFIKDNDLIINKEGHLDFKRLYSIMNKLHKEKIGNKLNDFAYEFWIKLKKTL